MKVTPEGSPGARCQAIIERTQNPSPGHEGATCRFTRQSEVPDLLLKVRTRRYADERWETHASRLASDFEPAEGIRVGRGGGSCAGTASCCAIAGRAGAIRHRPRD